jgi:hypothetical protein
MAGTVTSVTECGVLLYLHVFAFNAAKGSVRGSLEEVKALRELMQLRGAKENLGNIVTESEDSLNLGNIVTESEDSLNLCNIVTESEDSLNLGNIVTESEDSLNLGNIVT